MSILTDEMREQVEKIVSAGLSDDAIAAFKKKVADISDDIQNDIEYQLTSRLVDYLGAFVAEMSGKVIDAILNGNEDEMRRYLSCDRAGWTGRSDSAYWTRKDPAEWHPIIHGKLFEHGGIALRAKLVAAYPDLLKNERILDLEDEVKSLIAQVNKANAEKDAMWERVRGAA